MLSAWSAFVKRCIEQDGEEEKYHHQEEERISADQASSALPARWALRLRGGIAEKWKKRICRAILPLQHAREHSSSLSELALMGKTRLLHFDSTWHNQGSSQQGQAGYLAEAPWAPWEGADHSSALLHDLGMRRNISAET